MSIALLGKELAGAQRDRALVVGCDPDKPSERGPHRRLPAHRVPDLAVDAANDGIQPCTTLEQPAELVQTGEPVCSKQAEHVECSIGANDGPVTGQQGARAELLEQRQRGQVLLQGSVRVDNRRRPFSEDMVPREHPPVRKDEPDMVARVPGQGDDLDAHLGKHLPGPASRREARRTELIPQGPQGLGVVRMAVGRHERAHPQTAALHELGNAVEVLGEQRARIDDDRIRSREEHVGVRAGKGHWRWVRREHPYHTGKVGNPLVRSITCGLRFVSRHQQPPRSASGTCSGYGVRQ